MSKHEMDYQQPDSTENSIDETERDTTDEAGTETDAPQTATPNADELQLQLEEANRRVLMAQAELENFRKRTRRDFEEQLKHAAHPLAKDLLEVVDNLERALASSDQDAGGLKSGVEMVRSQLIAVLEKHGVSRITSIGEPFDPNMHEAIGQMPSDDHPQGNVAHEALPGYKLHERVLRPSQVLVSQGNGDAPQE